VIMKSGLDLQLNSIRRMIKEDKWMSSFYGEAWHTIDESPNEEDFIAPGLYEWKIKSTDANDISRAQALNFELVEIQVEFKTSVLPTIKDHTIRIAKLSDIPVILEITHRCFLEDDSFQSRFKNKTYFTTEQAMAYYEASIVNYFDHPGSFSSVAEIDGEVVGYYMMVHVEENTYRGIMSAVLPNARRNQLHIKMQHHCWGEVGKELDVINKTQLSNLKVLKNHIREKRELTAIDYIFLKKIQ